MTEEMKNVTPETAEAPEHVETMEDYKEELEASFKQIHEGDILTGTVIGVSESAITLDLKYYTDGIIRLEDFTNDPNFNLAEDIHVGDEISATVIRRDDGEGHILLSAKEANEVLAWDKLRKYKEEGTNLKVKIAGIVKFRRCGLSGRHPWLHPRFQTRPELCGRGRSQRLARQRDRGPRHHSR